MARSFWNQLFSFVGRDLAMDLGTANTLIYTREDGIVLNEPSVVAFDTRKHKVLAVGHEAKEFMGRTPQRINAVRPLKDGVIADFDATRAMIAYFIRKVIGNGGMFKPKMVIGVPSEITQVEKRAVIESAEGAGIRDVRLIEEPMAAAIGAGMPIDEPRGNMVVDIGGGTTEVAVISMSAVAFVKSVRVAGDELNESIQRYFQDKFSMLIGENNAERIKQQIGSAVPQPETLSMLVSGRSLISGGPESVTVYDDQIREAMAEPLRPVVQAILSTMERTPPELLADISNSGLLLAGGGAMLRGIDQLISEAANVRVIIDKDPLTTVVRGAGKTFEDQKYYEQMYIN